MKCKIYKSLFDAVEKWDLNTDDSKMNKSLDQQIMNSKFKGASIEKYQVQLRN